MNRREAFAAVPAALLGLTVQAAEQEPPADMTPDELDEVELSSGHDMTPDEMEDLAATLLTEANKLRRHETRS